MVRVIAFALLAQAALLAVSVTVTVKDPSGGLISNPEILVQPAPRQQDGGMLDLALGK